MKWFAGAILLLLVALIFDLGLLAYAMYVLLGVMVVSRLLSRAWAVSISAVSFRLLVISVLSVVIRLTRV